MFFVCMEYLPIVGIYSNITINTHIYTMDIIVI